MLFAFRIMILQAIASAFPPHLIKQSDTLAILEKSDVFQGLKPVSRKLLSKVLKQETSGIATRCSATTDYATLMSAGPGWLNAYFEQAAPDLAMQAANRAFERASILPSEIDALLVCSCTGYICPGVSGHVAERLGLDENTIFLDVAGHGCGAAVPLLHTAANYLAAHPDHTVLTVAVEVCSAAFHIDDDAGVLISAALFGDGAAAAIWRSGDTGWRAHDFRSIHAPEHREVLRFQNADGRLRNRLERCVPEVAADIVGRLYKIANPGANTRVIAHGGGRRVIERLREKMPGESLEEAEWVLHHYGNMSSPSLLVALERALEKPGDDLWLTGFGAGFSAHACRLTKIAA